MIPEGYKPEVGAEAWVRERYYSRTSLFLGKVVKVTPSLQIVVEYAENGSTRQVRFKPSKWGSKDWDEMGQSGYSQTYRQLFVGPALNDAKRLELRREAALSRGGRKVAAALKAVSDLRIPYDASPDQLRVPREAVQALLVAIDAAIELHTMPEPPAETED